MGIIPKEGEEKEPIGVISLVLAHYVLGLGILIIGQRTKNVYEFWGGLLVFLFIIGYVFLGLMASGSSDAFMGSWFAVIYALLSLMTWIYIVARLAWIVIKKETRLTIL